MDSSTEDMQVFEDRPGRHSWEASALTTTPPLLSCSPKLSPAPLTSLKLEGVSQGTMVFNAMVKFSL